MSAYSNEVLVDSPFAYFEDASAAPWNDVEGGTDITIAGATANQPGPLASGDTKAFSFDGVDDGGTVAYDLTDTSTVTFEYWMLWDTNGTDNDMAFSFGPDASSAVGRFQVNHNSASGVQAHTTGNVGGNQKLYTRPSQGVWHHYAWVVDYTQNGANEITAYLDGALWTPDSQPLASDNASGTLFSTETLYVMNRAGALYGAGDMAHLAVYKSALSAARVLAHFEAADDAPPAPAPSLFVVQSGSRFS